jgi:hypothetical protein
MGTIKAPRRAAGLKECPVDKCTICADKATGEIRTFASGATRDTEDGKLDFEAYLSPVVLLRYAEYMQEHQTRSDGTHRAGDDWQQGIPKDVYAKSMLRHLMDFWLLHRDCNGVATNDMQTALCAVIFNAMGYLHNEIEGLE